jgi:hypothetical protein
VRLFDSLLMSVKVKVPTVQIPTLRQSVSGVIGSGMFIATPVAQEVLHGPSSDIEIDELVHGVRQCQAAVKRAGEVFRRQRNVTEVNADAKLPQQRRVRSPTPIGDRKPWGASVPAPTTTSVSPRSRQTTTAAPSTVAKNQPRSQGFTPRPNTPTHQDPMQSVPSKPFLRAHSSLSSTSKDIHRPKIDANSAHIQSQQQHSTPPTATARRAGPTPTSASPSPAPKTQQRTSDIEAKVHHMEEHVKQLEEQLVLTSERVHQLEERNAQLESRVVAMQKDSDSTQIAARQQFLHVSAQQQHMWEVIKRLEAYIVAEHYGDDGAEEVPQHEDGYYRSSAVVAEAHHNLHPAVPNPTVIFSQERHHYAQQSTSVTSSGAQVSRPQSGAVSMPGDVARRLDMSNESNRSATSRVPPNPPMELRQN